MLKFEDLHEFVLIGHSYGGGPRPQQPVTSPPYTQLGTYRSGAANRRSGYLRTPLRFLFALRTIGCVSAEQ